MSDALISVGLDVGTTSTQLIVSRLRVENRASGFAVPDMAITRREILYKSPVHFTPLIRDALVDGAALKTLVEAEYDNAGIRREDVDTGAVIITGETSRKENARTVLSALSELAGDFVVATAGPDLESVLAAKGAGAAAYSRQTGKTVLHMDIGGGTSNLALIRAGEIAATGCLNVGGRLIKVDEAGRITYVSPVAAPLFSQTVGQTVELSAVEALAETLTRGLEMAAGLREPDALLDRLTTEGTAMAPPEESCVLSFSGGVADCIESDLPPFQFGDMGPVLGKAIRKSRLCAGTYRLGSETIRATVIGAGCHSTRLSGSTVFCKNVELPLKNRPVVCLSAAEQRLPAPELTRCIRQKLARQDTECVLFLPGLAAPAYDRVRELARAVADAFGGRRVLVAMEQDMAKALGQAMSLLLPAGTGCLCLDSLPLADGSYLDVGAPVGPAVPVVIKTLIFSH